MFAWQSMLYNALTFLKWIAFEGYDKTVNGELWRTVN